MTVGGLQRMDFGGLENDRRHHCFGAVQMWGLVMLVVHGLI